MIRRELNERDWVGVKMRGHRKHRQLGPDSIVYFVTLGILGRLILRLPHHMLLPERRRGARRGSEGSLCDSLEVPSLF